MILKLIFQQNSILWSNIYIGQVYLTHAINIQGNDKTLFQQIINIISQSLITKMLDAFVYIFFFWALLAESFVFILLNMPAPKGVKGRVLKFLSTNKLVSILMYVHLLLSLIALIFYLDLSNQQSHFLVEKDQMKHDTARHIGSELRLGFLSYTILKIQRNKYITFMLIYTSIALSLFVLLLKQIYTKRDQLQGLGLLDKIERKNSQKLQPHQMQHKDSEKDKKVK